jgi:hypothetical protein
MILQGGMGKYLKYCIVVFSLQIWPALNSVLNLFIELYSNIKGSGITGGALTYGNFNQAHQAVETIVLVASGLQMSIPFLSFAIVQGGVQSFVHLAGSVQSASAGAASIASGEITSGSRSFDNISKGNQNIDQKSGFKTDWNQSFQEGARQVQGASGAMYRSFADGSSAINSGSGMDLSSGSRKFGLSSGVQVSAQQGLTNALTAASGADQNFNNSMTSSKRAGVNLISQLAKSESEDKSIDYKELGEKGQTLQQLVNATKAYHDRTEDSWEQSAQASLDLYINAGGKIPDFVPILKGESGVKIQGGVYAANKSNQSLGTEEGVTRSNDTNKSSSTQEAVAKNKQWMERYNIDSSFAEEAQGSYEKAQSYQQMASQKREEADTYRQALEYSKNIGATDDRDMYHEVEQGIMNQHGVSQNEAHKMIENNDPRANKVWDGIVGENLASTLSKINAGRDHVENIATTGADNFHDNNANKVNDNEVVALKEKAASQGLKKKEFEEKIEEAENNLKEKHSNMTIENDIDYKSVLFVNKQQEKDLEQKAMGYENSRFSQYALIGGDTSAQKAAAKAIKDMQDRIKPLNQED